MVWVSSFFYRFAVDGHSSSQALVSWGLHLSNHFPCQMGMASENRDGHPDCSQHLFFLEVRQYEPGPAAEVTGRLLITADLDLVWDTRVALCVLGSSRTMFVLLALGRQTRESTSVPTEDVML